MKLYMDVCFKFVDGRLTLFHSKTVDINVKKVPLAKGRSAPVQTTTTNTAPWVGQQPYLTHAFGEAQNLYNQNKGGIPFFPGQTYANQSPQTLQALQGMEARATGGSPISRAGNEQFLKTLQGDYLNNPYLSKAIQSEFNQILPTLQSNAAKSGNYFSSAAQLAQGRELGNIIDRRMADQYNRERARQHEAIGAAPGYAQQEYNDLSRLLGVGGAQEAQQQLAIDEARARHEQQYASPQEQLARYINMINGSYGTQGSQQTTGFKGNRGAGVLGGALGGAGLAAQFGTAAAPTGPLGMAIGTGLGGLLGML